MRLYLALSYPEAVGGVISGGQVQRHLSAFSAGLESPPPMKLHLATFPEGWGDSKNPNSQFVSGTVQWESFRERERERERESKMRLKILLSYWYYKDADLDALFKKYFTEPYPEVFADSGAFSAMTQGGEVNINNYAKWIKRYRHLFASYANLDVIKNAEKTWENQQTLEAMGLTPLPAFHVMEDFKWLEHYIDLYPYIALGVAGNQAKRNKVMAWLIQCFRAAGSKSVFHGFGLTSWTIMSNFAWYSVDSSSWGSGFRFGTVPLFDSKRGRFEKCKLGDIASCRKVENLFLELGFDWKDFADRKRNDRAKICAVSALAYMKAEEFLRRKFGDVYIPTRDDAPAGLRAHLADANPNRFSEAASGLRLHLADTGGIKENYARAEVGVKVHLADARGNTAADLSATKSGLKLHLAEHSLDRGGVGDTSRAMEMLNAKNSL